MTWVKLDDRFPNHPKVVAAGPSAAWLYVCGLAYCSQYLTDGFIPSAQVRRLADVKHADALAEKLVSVGLWEHAEDGYRVHDYADYQRSAERVQTERERGAERQERFRSRRQSPPPTTPDPKPHNGVSNAVTHGPVTVDRVRVRERGVLPNGRTSVPRAPTKAETQAGAPFLLAYRKHTGRVVKSRDDTLAAADLVEQERDADELEAVLTWMGRSPYHGDPSKLRSVERNWPRYEAEKEAGACRCGKSGSSQPERREPIYVAFRGYEVQAS